MSRGLASDRACCILVPLYKVNWSHAEIAALARCLRVLSSYHFIFVHKAIHEVEQVLQPWIDDVMTIRSWSSLPLDSNYLSSVKAYNKLLLCPRFYRALSDWDYVLIFQLDAWILSGNIEQWLSAGYTYVGAPWCPSLGDDPGCADEGVGNGGLSLRNVNEMIRILSSRKYRFKPVYSVPELVAATHLFDQYPTDYSIRLSFAFCKRAVGLFCKVFLWPLGFHNSLAYFASKDFNEDIILSNLSSRVYSWVRLPSLDQAALFSLETNPREVAAAYDIDIPFGCHAWERRDKDFFLTAYPSCFTELQNTKI